MKHSPQIELTRAKLACSAAENDCPHWDWDSESDHDCCLDLREAERRLKQIKRRMARELS